MKRAHVADGEEEKEEDQSEQINQTPVFSASTSLASHAGRRGARTTNACEQCKERKTKVYSCSHVQTLPGQGIGHPAQDFDQFSMSSIYQRESSATLLEQKYNMTTRMNNSFAPQDHNYDSITDVNLDYFSFFSQFQPPKGFAPSATSSVAPQNTSMNDCVSKRIYQGPNFTPLPWLQFAETSTLSSGASLGSGRPFDSEMPPPALPQRQTQKQRYAPTQVQAQAQVLGDPQPKYKRTRRRNPFATRTSELLAPGSRFDAPPLVEGKPGDSSRFSVV